MSRENLVTILNGQPVKGRSRLAVEARQATKRQRTRGTARAASLRDWS